MKPRQITVNGTVYTMEDNGEVHRHIPAQPAIAPCAQCGATDDGSWCSPYCWGPFGREAIPARRTVHGIAQRTANGWQIALRCEARNDGSRVWVGTLVRGVPGWLSADNAAAVLRDDRLRTFRTLAAALA
jgi:hypothetical protein